MEMSLSEVVRRHEALRTRLVEVDGDIMQTIRPLPELSFEIIDLRQFPGDKEEQGRAACLENRACPFHLEGSHMIRATLVRLGAEDHFLGLVVHHAAADTWSLAVVLEELSVLYSAYSAGRRSPLSDPPVQYADYSAWLHERVSSGALSADRDF